MTTINRAVKLLAALLIPSVLIWLSFGFVVWNWHPGTWGETMRSAFVWASFMLTIPAVALFGGSK